MSWRPARVTMIIGSTREGRFGLVAADAVAELIREREDVVLEVVDLAEAALPTVLTDRTPPEVRELGARLDASDAFVVVTPEYNHSFPAALKNAIDWFSDEWRAKPVGHVGYGGVAGAQRAVEHLRLVFEELHAVSMRTSVALCNYWEEVGVDGALALRKPHQAAVTEMMDQLVWWADALRTHRDRVPYTS